jgi:outer membrane protein assembly factor BamE
MRKATILLAAFFCAACSNYSANLPSIKPYKMDIQQGNVVTSKMMMQLRPGMTKSQVRFVMGTPLIADSFHANRWDYLYRMVKEGKVIEQRHVILDFENDQLKGVRGDVIPAGTGDTGATAAIPKPEGAKPVTPQKKEKGLIDKLKFWKGDEEQVPAKVEPQPAPVKAPESKPAVAPQLMEETPAPAAKAAPAPEAEQKQPPATEPQAVEQPKAEPVKQPEAQVKPEPKAAAPKAAPVEVEPAKVEPKTASIPADELPPEDDPGYFERMLEKIGF